MDAEFCILFNQETKTLPDATRWAVRLERWYCYINSQQTHKRYILFCGMQYNDGSGWCFAPDAEIKILEGNNAAHHIRRAISAFDELTGADNDDN